MLCSVTDRPNNIRTREVTLFISVDITLEWKQSLCRRSRTVASLQLRYILCSAPVTVIWELLWPFELTSSEMKDIFLSSRQANCCFE